MYKHQNSRGSGSFSWVQDFRPYFCCSWYVYGLNGVWGIFRDYKLKPWQSFSVMGVIIIGGLAFTLWGIKTILNIPYATTTTSQILVK